MILRLNESVLKIKDDISVDFESFEEMVINIRATDPYGLYKDQMFEIEVLDDPSDNYAPLPPTEILLDNLSVDENSPGANIANISGVNSNGDNLTYVVFNSRDGAFWR